MSVSALVRARGVEPLTIASGDFTYGRALNRAAAAAGGDVLVAISAQAVPADARWAWRMAVRRTRGEVAAVRSFRPVSAVPLRAAHAEWWRGPPAHRSALRARLDPRRAAMVAGKWAALR